MNGKSFTQSVVEFEAANEWLSDSDAPQIAGMYALADVLDNGKITPAAIGQFTLIARSLERKAPKQDVADDDDDLFGPAS